MHFWTIGPYMPALKVKQCSTSLFSPKRTALDCLTRTDQYSSRYNAVLPATSTGLAFHLTAHIFFIRKWKASSITLYGNLSTRARSILECLLPFPLVPFFLPLCSPWAKPHASCGISTRTAAPRNVALKKNKKGPTWQLRGGRPDPDARTAKCFSAPNHSLFSCVWARTGPPTPILIPIFYLFFKSRPRINQEPSNKP